MIRLPDLYKHVLPDKCSLAGLLSKNAFLQNNHLTFPPPFHMIKESIIISIPMSIVFFGQGLGHRIIWALKYRRK